MSSREWYFRIDDMLQALAGIAEDIDGLDYQNFMTDKPRPIRKP
ncbi:hypothetical protein [Methylocucumis oryzae]|nr:hypothetical protein [Methylocucumis oryzae]